MKKISVVNPIVRTWSGNVELALKCFYICQDLKRSELSTPHGTFSTYAELRPGTGHRARIASFPSSLCSGKRPKARRQNRNKVHY
jgi:hypothetical protein